MKIDKGDNAFNSPFMYIVCVFMYDESSSYYSKYSHFFYNIISGIIICNVLHNLIIINHDKTHCYV